MPIKCKINLLSEKAKIPTRAHSSDSGYDLTLIDIKKIEGDVIYFGTGISVQPSSNYYLEVYPRSSISKLPLGLANSVGIIDNGYSGEIMVPVRVFHKMQGQLQNSETTIPMGIVEIFGTKVSSMRGVGQAILKHKPTLFQMIMRKKHSVEFEVASLEETERGDGGFGSTDAKTSAVKKALIDPSVVLGE
jgi:dUTPase